MARTKADLRRCAKCKRHWIATKTNFYVLKNWNGRKRLDSYCKPCRIKLSQEWQEKNRRAK